MAAIPITAATAVLYVRTKELPKPAAAGMENVHIHAMITRSTVAPTQNQCAYLKTSSKMTRRIAADVTERVQTMSFARMDNALSAHAMATSAFLTMPVLIRMTIAARSA